MLKKKYLKRKDICKVTFYTAPELTAESVALVGEFNDWSESATPMTALKDGRFKATVDLPRNKRYQFRYLINECEWDNDWAADQYVPNPFYGDNSVVEV
ncbi:MAG: isoamylase early set domain-containing protein [Chloroflexota bacterium]|nr:isoamylase early set domain-containing protein [Chloroflexota bacterium]MDE2858642.1 isoamylase early set domain-containing protein [Chloroflexota bacterium]MDE2950676.1 isoamylase early set domain-containing protein [Chloroflexota bacterium]